MRLIIADIYTLTQHILELKANADKYRPESCCYCNNPRLRCHGYYTRKADRENEISKTLNPIKIPRFYCPSCKKTCSVLPECIPPRRWYLWDIQQACLLLVLCGKSIYQTAKKGLPSRWTIGRWLTRLKEQSALYTFHLKSRFSGFGYLNEFEKFWKNCLEKLSLAKIMYILNKFGVHIP